MWGARLRHLPAFPFASYLHISIFSHFIYNWPHSFDDPVKTHQDGWQSKKFSRVWRDKARKS